MKRYVHVMSSAMLLAGCHGATPPNSVGRNAPPSLVPVSAVLNAVKCELARTFAMHDYARDLLGDIPDGPKVTGTLTLSDVVSTKVAGEAAIEVKALGFTLGPKGSASRATTRTNTVALDFTYAVADRRPVPGFCATLDKSVRVDGAPFVALLDGVRNEHARIQAGEPKVKLGPITYTAGFDVEKELEGGVEISVLVFTLGATRTRTTTASQELSLTFSLDKLPATVPM